MQSPRDELLHSIAGKISTSVLSDLLDELGYRNQILSPSIRPIDTERGMVGRARTALYREIHEVPPDTHPFALQISLVDDLQPGEIPVTACGGTKRVAIWGELLSTAAKARGAAGFLTDGVVRDIGLIRDMEFPLFCAGASPVAETGRGIIAEIDGVIKCGGVIVTPGDLIVGDTDGVIAVPKGIESTVLERAAAKINGEDRTREELARGVKLADVYARLGVL